MGAAVLPVGASCGLRGRVDGRIKSGHDVGVTEEGDGSGLRNLIRFHKYLPPNDP